MTCNVNFWYVGYLICDLKWACNPHVEKITSWFAVEDFSTATPRCFYTFKSHLLPGTWNGSPLNAPDFLTELPEIFGFILRSLPPWQMHSFLYWLCIGSVFGCADLHTEECQGVQGPRKMPQSWWDSPLCNPGAVRLEIVGKRNHRGQGRLNHPRRLLPLDRTSSSVLSPLAKISSYLSLGLICLVIAWGAQLLLRKKI